MKIWKWDRVHNVGIKLRVLFVVMGQRGTKFRPASGFCDFLVLFAVMVEAGLNLVETRLCCEFASCSTVPSLLHIC